MLVDVGGSLVVIGVEVVVVAGVVDFWVAVVVDMVVCLKEPISVETTHGSKPTTLPCGSYLHTVYTALYLPNPGFANSWLIVHSEFTAQPSFFDIRGLNFKI